MVSQDPKQPKPTNVPPAPTESTPIAPRPPVNIPQWIANIMPQFDLVIKDVLCPGARQFLAAVQPASLLQDAVVGVLEELYDEETVPKKLKHLRVVIKETDGVAETRQVELTFQTCFLGIYTSCARDLPAVTKPGKQSFSTPNT
jgi:hypothetical protein